jgi:6-phosphogluconate dehydrogenase
MQLEMIGVGWIGSNMMQRLLNDGHECVVHDTHPQATQELVSKGAKPATALAEFIKKLTKPRAEWLMVPAAVVDSVLESLKPLLDKGDIVDRWQQLLLSRRYPPRRATQTIRR